MISAHLVHRMLRLLAVASLLISAGLVVGACEPTPPPVPPPPAGTVSPQALVAGLAVAPEHARTGYSRSAFRLWITQPDGCSTREVVLVTEARGGSRAHCAAPGAHWISLYDNVKTSSPSSFDIDHMVPLAEAWDSGAWAWSPTRREAFANDVAHPASLRAVSASSNRSKGDEDPTTWSPPARSSWCQYAADWASTKKTWALSTDESEKAALTAMARGCAPVTLGAIPPG